MKENKLRGTTCEHSKIIVYGPGKRNINLLISNTKFKRVLHNAK